MEWTFKKSNLRALVKWNWKTRLGTVKVVGRVLQWSVYNVRREERCEKQKAVISPTMTKEREQKYKASKPQ